VVVLEDMIRVFYQLLRTREAIELLLGFLDRQAQLSIGSHYGKSRCTIVNQYDLTLITPVSTARTTCTSDCSAVPLAVCWSIAGTQGAGSLLYQNDLVNFVVITF